MCVFLKKQMHSQQLKASGGKGIYSDSQVKVYLKIRSVKGVITKVL